MKKNNALKISLFAVIFGILAGLLVVALTGRNPMRVLTAMAKTMTGFDFNNLSNGFRFKYILDWLAATCPIILTGLSVAFAYRTGLFNIGAEGQYMLGCFASACVALLIDLPPVLHCIVAILAGILAGALWGVIPGLLKAYRNINEVVVCIMLNYGGMYLVNALLRLFLPIDYKTNQRTINFPDSAILENVFPNETSQFTWGFLVVILALIIYWFVIEKTTFGYSLRATGLNKEGARFAGMKVEKNIIYSMAIAGAFAGAAGAITALGVYHYGQYFTLMGTYGFDGISVALVGTCDALGIVFSGLLFGMLNACVMHLQLNGIPSELSQVIQACIIFFVAIQYGVQLLLNYFEKKKNKKKDLALEGGNGHE